MRAEGEALSIGDNENPFSLLYQPPSTFLPLPLELTPPLSNEPSLVSTGLANYLESLCSQSVSRHQLTLSLSEDQPVSSQRTQYDISGNIYLLFHCAHHILTLKKIDFIYVVVCRILLALAVAIFTCLTYVLRCTVFISS